MTFLKVGAGRDISPWNNVVADYGANNTGGAAAGTRTAINNAIANSNSTGRSLYFPAGTYNINGSLTAITKNGVRIVGDGRWNTIISPSFASGNIITLSSQFATVEDLAIQSSVFRTGGFDIAVTAGASNCLLRNIFNSFSHNGISVTDASEVIIENIQFRYLTGNQGLLFTGTSGGGGSYGLRVKNILADNPYTINVFNPNLKGNFTASTAYSLGDIFIANSWIWQVVVAGTTGSTAPAAPTSATWFSTNVTNGTAQLRAISRLDLTWILMDNYSNSLTILESALIDGGIGLRMQNTAGLSTSFPNWIFAYDLEIDHPYSAGIDLQRGYGLFATSCWIGSSFVGNGIQADANFAGEIVINDSRISASGQHGILMNGCPDFKIQDSFVVDNGINSSTAGIPPYFVPGTFHDVTVAANSIGFTITGCSFGGQTRTGISPPYTGTAVTIGTGCNNFIVTGNMSRGNLTTNINNLSGTSNTKVVTNNSW